MRLAWKGTLLAKGKGTVVNYKRNVVYYFASKSCVTLTVTDNDATLAMPNSVLVQSALLQALKSGIVGGQAVVLGTGTAMPKWHQAPHHWLDNIHVF